MLVTGRKSDTVGGPENWSLDTEYIYISGTLLMIQNRELLDDNLHYEAVPYYLIENTPWSRSQGITSSAHNTPIVADLYCFGEHIS